MSDVKVKRGPNCPKDVFVKTVWAKFNAGQGHQAIADDCNMKVGSVATRIAAYKKAGVNMPTFPTGGNNKLNVEALNKMIEELNS